MYLRKTHDAVFIMRRLKEEYHAEEKSCMCDVDKRKHLIEYQRKSWTMRKKRIPDVLFEVMSLYEGTTTRVKSQRGF